jgi:CBS-domain-containing membrane protein
VFSVLANAIAVGVLAVAAVVIQRPLVFPSLGPTALLIFTHPRQAASSPRNAITGHAVALAAGYLALVLFGLTHAPSAVTTGVTWSRAGAAALSLGLLAGTLAALRMPHPPAAATVLIVSLGILHTLAQLAVVLGAVAALLVVAFALEHVVGEPYPWWSWRGRTTGTPRRPFARRGARRER